MKIAYLNCASGISGDMLLAALIDAGASLKELNRQLATLNIRGLRLVKRRVPRGHIHAVQITVRADGKTRLNDMQRVARTLKRSGLSAAVKQKVAEVFSLLAGAEAKVHRESEPAVHFHQLGDVDTIADITGCVVAFDMLRIRRVYASPVVVGTGQVSAGAEVFPVPAPAVLELLRGRTLRVDSRISQETVTPTGAALLRAFTVESQGVVACNVERTGYGAGTRQIAHLPNVLTLMLGRDADSHPREEICMIEATIDDMLPLAVQPLFESLLAAGALDVCTIPVLMKKQRPGIMVQVLAPPARQENILEVIFRQTTTLGVRIQRVQRRVLERKLLKIKTEYGIIVDVKLGLFEGQIVTVSPEYEHCRRIAKQKGLAFKTVYDVIKAQALQKVQA